MLSIVVEVRGRRCVELRLVMAAFFSFLLWRSPKRGAGILDVGFGTYIISTVCNRSQPKEKRY